MKITTKVRAGVLTVGGGGGTRSRCC